MVINDFSGNSSLGLGATARLQKSPALERSGVTLQAQLDPKAPHQYSVSLPPEVISPPERVTDTKPPGKRDHQNTDPISQLFFSIEDYGPTIHKIDIKI
jgi:hypothetical protein